jgi:hypothetical protein
MKRLAGRASSSIRKFPRITQVFELSDKITTSVGTKDIKLQKKMAQDVNKYTSLGLLPSDEPDQAEMDALQRQRGKGPTELAEYKRTEAAIILNWAYKFEGGMSRLKNELDALKIKNAAGKRVNEAGQKAVMGNVSATDVSKHELSDASV